MRRAFELIYFLFSSLSEHSRSFWNITILKTDFYLATVSHISLLEMHGLRSHPGPTETWSKSSDFLEFTNKINLKGIDLEHQSIWTQSLNDFSFYIECSQWTPNYFNMAHGSRCITVRHNLWALLIPHLLVSNRLSATRVIFLLLEHIVKTWRYLFPLTTSSCSWSLRVVWIIQWFLYHLSTRTTVSLYSESSHKIICFSALN